MIESITLNKALQFEINELISHLKTEFEWGIYYETKTLRDRNLYLTRGEFLGFIKEFCPTLCSQFGDRQVIPVMISHLWAYFIKCDYKKFTRDGQQMTGFVIIDEGEMTEYKKVFAEFNF